ncbi:hypothetical protein [Natronobacterium texcoconense]|uniref:hypothetical protein n=1 Tax=Natronobacterium texcoconense TaxID=1095778 RepID=UPI001FCD7338|nr:hypothetical protein [Natronobacterium texcoconense]
MSVGITLVGCDLTVDDSDAAFYVEVREVGVGLVDSRVDDRYRRPLARRVCLCLAYVLNLLVPEQFVVDGVGVVRNLVVLVLEDGRDLEREVRYGSGDAADGLEVVGRVFGASYQ